MPGAATAAGAEFTCTCAWLGGADAWSTFVLARSELEPCAPGGDDISTEPLMRTPEAGSGVGVGLGGRAPAADDPPPGAATAAVAAGPVARGSVWPTAR